ncbi:MAG: sarcosine oxidase subunit gamma family protein [Roseicyclus sp.]
MADLTARSPAQGLLPIAHGTLTLSEAPMQPIWAIAPYRGKQETLSKALQKAHGLAFPAVGELASAKASRIAWSGMNQAFLFGTAPDAALADHAALTDQSDAWTHLVLEGPAVRDVLARWVPADLSRGSLPVGRSLRSLVGHMSALILHPEDDRFEILIFRSMAGTAVHELTKAMKIIEARGAIA